MDQLLPTPVFLEEIHNFIRVTNALMAIRREPQPRRLSKEERAAIGFYLQELHFFLRDQETQADPSQHTFAF